MDNKTEVIEAEVVDFSKLTKAELVDIANQQQEQLKATDGYISEVNRRGKEVEDFYVDKVEVLSNRIRGVILYNERKTEAIVSGINALLNLYTLDSFNIDKEGAEE